MKKKILNALMMLTLVGVLALNVSVVLNDDAAAYLKWEAVGKILANSTSGSCDLCVVKQFGAVKFSCKYEEDSTCKSPSQLGATVTCARATVCD